MSNDSPYLTKAQKVAAYAERFFQRTGRTAFPTVRQVSRGCGIPQSDIAEFCEEGVFGLMSTSYNVSPPQPWGEHSVEICR